MCKHKRREHVKLKTIVVFFSVVLGVLFMACAAAAFATLTANRTAPSGLKMEAIICMASELGTDDFTFIYNLGNVAPVPFYLNRATNDQPLNVQNGVCKAGALLRKPVSFPLLA